MADKLTRFEGQPVKAARLKVNGLSSSIDEALHVGDIGYAVIEYELGEVGHVNDDKIGLIRVHKANLIRHASMEGPDARFILDAADEAQRLAEEAASGISRLPLEPDAAAQ